MQKFEENIWYTIADNGPPPFDTLVLVHGDREVFDYTGKSHGFVPCKALAYNNAYRPEMAMTQVLELSKEDKKNLNKIYVEVPFTITKWMIV